MIDEAIGKILGMAMAYGVSSLGLFLAYVNYRKRILKADKVMTGTAWAVVAAILLGIVAGVVVVAQLAGGAAPEEAVAAAPEPPVIRVEPAAEGSQWPLLGIVLPAVIFLAATWITVALYKHFSKTTHTVEAEGGR